MNAPTAGSDPVARPLAPEQRSRLQASLSRQVGREVDIGE